MQGSLSLFGCGEVWTSRAGSMLRWTASWFSLGPSLGAPGINLKYGWGHSAWAVSYANEAKLPGWMHGLTCLCVPTDNLTAKLSCDVKDLGRVTHDRIRSLEAYTKAASTGTIDMYLISFTSRFRSEGATASDGDSAMRAMYFG